MSTENPSKIVSTNQRPPVRRRRVPPVRRLVIKERPRPPKRNLALPWLFIFFVGMVGLAWFMGSFDELIRLDPSTLTADTTPRPKAESDLPLAQSLGDGLRKDFKAAIVANDYEQAAGLATKIQEKGGKLGADLASFQTLEQNYRADLEQRFQSAKKENDPVGMAAAHTALSERWPDDPKVLEWADQMGQLQQEQQNAEQAAKLLGLYDKQVNKRQFLKATNTLNELSKLGHSVATERARFIKTLTLPGNVRMRFRYIPPGKFTMGSPLSEAGRADDEIQHEVTISKGFWMSETEVTQAQFEAVMEFSKSDPEGPNLPVNNVLLAEALSMARRMNLKEGIEGVRLPTEAEWEYACRADGQTPFHTGATLPATRANYDGNYPYGNGKKGPYRKSVSPVRSYWPNAWGLYDMHGNVWEWCDDKYDAYPNGPVTDPRNANFIIKSWIVRGGGWGDYAEVCRSANRHHFPQQIRINSLGFRLVMDLKP